jgi:hypothetical protein
MEIKGDLEVAAKRGRPSEDLSLDTPDSVAVQNWLRNAKLDGFLMRRLRQTLTETGHEVSRMSDDDVIRAVTSGLAAKRLVIAQPAEPMEPPPPPPARQKMSGYFTAFRYIAGQSLDQLEKTIGYPNGALSGKGALIYRLLKVPEVDEFEAGGASPTATVGTPSGRVQRSNARMSMALTGPGLRVTGFPRTGPASEFMPGAGGPAWRLTAGAIEGELLFEVAPGDNVPARA